MFRQLMIVLGSAIVLLLPNPLYASSWGVLVVAPADLGVDRSSGLRVYAGIPFSGEVRVRHANGELASVDQYREGRRHGYAKNYFRSGQLGYQMSFVDGQRHGLALTWWSNGSRRSKSQFVNDQLEGEAWEWYKNGNKFKRAHYENGQPVGMQKGWRQNGKLFSNYEYRNGRIYGLANANMCVEIKL